MLPTEKTPPDIKLNRQTILIYGPSKIGKSTFCSQIDNALFLATEPGLNGLETYNMPIKTWRELLDASSEISKMDHKFEFIVIDTIDNAYQMCSEYICERHKVFHESELQWGTGYAFVRNEFHRVINKLSLLPMGLILISHSKEKEIKTRTGSFSKIVPTLPEKASDMIVGLADIILYCDIENKINENDKPYFNRVIHTKQHTDYEAGDRTKKLPETLPLDFNEFVKYFNNKKGASK